jgi:hypothetical protein
MKITIQNTRIAFASIFEASAYGENEPKFSLKAIIAPASPTASELRRAFLSVAKEKWGAKGEAIYQQLVGQGKVALVEGDYLNAAGDPYDGFAGNYYVSASSKSRPLVIDRDKTPLVAADGKPYSGCYCNVQIEIWAQDNKWGKRLNAELKGVQFVKDGVAFSGSAPASTDDFEDLSVEDGADLV